MKPLAGNPEPQPRRRRANGAGSVYQRASDGKWVGSAYVLTSAGTTKRVPVYGKDQEEATKKLAKLVADSERGIALPDRSWKMRDWLPYWLAEYGIELRPRTLQGYESIVRLYLIPYLGAKRLDKLTAQDVRQFLTKVRLTCVCCLNKKDQHRPAAKQRCSVKRCCKSHPSVRQVQYVHAVLRNSLGLAVREEIITRNVAQLVRVPSPKYKVGKGLTILEVKRLLAATKGHRLYALYVLAATMGLRRGELLGLKWENLDLEQGILRVEHSLQRVKRQLMLVDPKTEDSERVVPIPELTWVTLLDHQKLQEQEKNVADTWTDHGLVFPTNVGTPMEPRNLNRHFSGIREKADLPGIRLHDLRHTVVTLLLEQNVPPHVVQAIAGHSDLAVTMKIYAQSNLDAMRRGLRQLDDQLD